MGVASRAALVPNRSFASQGHVEASRCPDVHAARAAHDGQRTAGDQLGELGNAVATEAHAHAHTTAPLARGTPFPAGFPLKLGA
jgi:hypothetical protein